jgi:DnaJ-class molecular chaperone
MGGEPDPFEVMAIDRSAPQSEVKRQCTSSSFCTTLQLHTTDYADYKLALLLHPDSSHPSSSPEHFAALHRAYTLLSNPSKRNSYIQTGYGWSANSANDSPGSTHSYEDRMRAEVRFRARGGAAAWQRRPYGYGYGESEGGRGAFGGFRGGDGKWEPYDTGEFDTKQGTGEERYMTNMQFLGLIAGIVSLSFASLAVGTDEKSIALGWAQFQRFMVVKDQGSELLEKQHLE